MTRLSRRRFVQQMAAGLGTLAASTLLNGCAPQPAATPAPTASVPIPTPRPSATVAPAGPTTAGATAAPAPTATPGIPDLVVARGVQPEELVRRALAALGGIEQFVHPGDEVIVKPNICVAYHSYEYAATTNPWVVAELVRLSLGAGARRVRVMDFPFGGSAEEAYARSGIQEQVLAAGGEMEFMSGFKYVSVDIPTPSRPLQCQIYDEILNADVVINVPIAKHHNLAGLTLGMKNLLGTIYDRPSMHRQLGERIAYLANYLRPALTVVDAVRILVDHGPTGGNLADVRQMDTLIASRDIVATDSYAATLFGLRPADLANVVAGVEIGLGRSDLENLLIEEIAVGG